jgi:hypothetical protein
MLQIMEIEGREVQVKGVENINEKNNKRKFPKS